MAIDFPLFPAVDELYTSGERTWRWNGFAWDLVNGDSRHQRTTAAAPAPKS